MNSAFASPPHFGIRPDFHQFLESPVPQVLTNGFTVHVLRPEDEFVHLAAHAASHHWSQARWFYDLVLMLSRYPDLDWDGVAARTAGLRLWPAVLLNLRGP